MHRCGKSMSYVMRISTKRGWLSIRCLGPVQVTFKDGCQSAGDVKLRYDGSRNKKDTGTFHISQVHPACHCAAQKLAAAWTEALLRDQLR